MGVKKNICLQSYHNTRHVLFQSEITEFKEKLQLARETIAKFKTEIGKVQKDRGVDGGVGSLIFN